MYCLKTNCNSHGLSLLMDLWTQGNCDILHIDRNVNVKFSPNSLCMVYCSHLIGDINLYVHFRLSGDKSPMLRPLRKCRYSLRTLHYYCLLHPPTPPVPNDKYTDYFLAKMEWQLTFTYILQNCAPFAISGLFIWIYLYKIQT